MKIMVNGQEKDVPQGLSVLDLLGILGLRVDRVAVELNRSILPKESYSAGALKEGDALEIVGFVGGG